MKLWIDDIRPAPEGYVWKKSVNSCLKFIGVALTFVSTWEEPGLFLDIDHDAGEYAVDGGDYVKILDALEKANLSMPISVHIHSQNPVGVENMRRIIKRNGWKEV